MAGQRQPVGDGDPGDVGRQRPAVDLARKELGLVEGLHRGDRTDECVVAGHEIEEAVIEARLRRLRRRSEEHTSELQSLMRISYAVFCLKKTNIKQKSTNLYHIY